MAFQKSLNNRGIMRSAPFNIKDHSWLRPTMINWLGFTNSSWRTMSTIVYGFYCMSQHTVCRSASIINLLKTSAMNAYVCVVCLRLISSCLSWILLIRGTRVGGWGEGVGGLRAKNKALSYFCLCVCGHKPVSTQLFKRKPTFFSFFSFFF